MQFWLIEIGLLIATDLAYTAGKKLGAFVLKEFENYAEREAKKALKLHVIEPAQTWIEEYFKTPTFDKQEKDNQDNVTVTVAGQADATGTYCLYDEYDVNGVVFLGEQPEYTHHEHAAAPGA